MRTLSVAAFVTAIAAMGVAQDRPTECLGCRAGTTEAIVNCVAPKLRNPDLNPALARKGVSCLVRAWANRDGSIAWGISDGFLNAVEFHPECFLEAMAAHPLALDEWLRDVDTLSFRWFRDGPSPLEKRRVALVGVLNATVAPTQLAESVRKKLLQRLREIKPTVVQ